MKAENFLNSLFTEKITLPCCRFKPVSPYLDFNKEEDVSSLKTFVLSLSLMKLKNEFKLMYTNKLWQLHAEQSSSLSYCNWMVEVIWLNPFKKMTVKYFALFSNDGFSLSNA